MSLRHVFSPKSIAIIGASTKVGSVGNDLVKNLAKNFTGKVFPINPKGGQLYGLPVLKSITDVPQSIDLAVIAVPAEIVPTVLKQAGKKHVSAAVIISAGFKEAGNLEAEQKLVKIANHYGITLVGPNCLGVINPHLQMNASFAPTMPPKGSIAFLSQSGALGTAILDYAAKHNLGFSKFLSMGNKAKISEEQVLDYLADDDETKVILMYIEQITQLQPVLDKALKIRKHRNPKPIIVLKSGQTDAGMQAAQSHTGALAGKDAFYDALFREAGIIRAQSIEELFLYAETFAENPPLKNNRTAVLTNAGGIGVLVTDALISNGLQLAELSHTTQKQLRSFLPNAASVHNPVDILGDAPAGRYKQALEIIMKDNNVDAIAVLLTPQSMTETLKTAIHISDLRKQYKKPLVASFLGGDKVTTGISILQSGDVTQLNYPEWTAKGLGTLYNFSTWKGFSQKEVTFRDFKHITLKKLLTHHKGWLRADHAFEVLEACKLPVVPWGVATSANQAATITSRLIDTKHPKVVLKVMSDDILHKSDSGGVQLNVTAATAADAYQLMIKKLKKSNPEAKIDGILIMQQIEQPKQEMLIGGIGHPTMGSLLGCGMGGVFTEAHKDVAFTLVPTSKDELDDLVARLRLSPILEGIRGQEPFDTTSLKKTLARIAYLLHKYPQIAELDINPLFVYHHNRGVQIADARIRCY